MTLSKHIPGLNLPSLAIPSLLPPKRTHSPLPVMEKIWPQASCPWTKKTGFLSKSSEDASWVLFTLSKDSQSLDNKPILGITTGSRAPWACFLQENFHVVQMSTGMPLSSHILLHKPRVYTEILYCFNERFIFCCCFENSYFPRNLFYNIVEYSLLG